MSSRFHRVLPAGAAALTALTLGLAHVPAADALAGGSTFESCGTNVQGAAWTIKLGAGAFNPDPSTKAGRAWPRLYGVRWAVGLEKKDGSRPDPTGDCQLADAVTSQDSSQATGAYQATGKDGSSCTFSAPGTGADHGRGVCTSGGFVVTFQPADITDQLTNCQPFFRAPRPPGDKRKAPHGFVWGAQVGTGITCGEAQKVIPKVWRVPVTPLKKQGKNPIQFHQTIRTTASVAHNGTEWVCGVWLLSGRLRAGSHHYVATTSGGGHCVLSARVPGYGLVQLGPEIYFIGPLGKF